MTGGVRRVGGLACRSLDGVPVLTSNVSGPLRGALLFRVGQADETLSTRGITHLVEHLALSTTARGPHAFNGATGDVFTAFVVAGEPRGVVQHLDQVCAALRSLPLDRLEHERGVIRTEAARRSGAFASALTTWRWGAQGYGLLGFEELGLTALTDDQISHWAATRFTASNAVLWLSGPMPKGLRLNLPDAASNEDWPLPSVDSLITLPAAFTLSDRGVGFSYLVPRAAESSALMYVVTKRLQSRLRDELGVSYHIESGIQRLSGDTSLHAYFADSLPENAQAVQQGVTDVLESLLEQPATAKELHEMRATAELAAQHQEGLQLSHLDYAARQLLLRAEIQTPLRIQREQRNVTPDSLRPSVRQALSTLLAAVPNAEVVPSRLAAQAPAWSDKRAPGRFYPPAPHRSNPRLTDLIVGATGISTLVGANSVTVNYSDCAAMIRYDDGARTLVGKDAFRVNFAPEDWLGSDDVPQLLDLRVPQDRWVPGGARERAQTNPARAVPHPSKPAGRRWTFRWRYSLVAAATFAAIGVISSLAGSSNNNGAGLTGDPTGQLPVTITLRAGDCLFTTANLDLGVSVTMPCAEPHQAEILSVRAEPATVTSGGLDAACDADARRILTPPAHASVLMRSVTTAGNELVCYAQSKTGAALQGSLARRH